MILKFNVKEQTISLVNTKSVPRIGSKDYLVLQFSFSSDWENLDKLVYLQSGDVSQPINIVDNLVEVPEWFTEQDSFNVTLFGTDGTTEVPTNVVSVQLEKSNDLWVKDAPEPQPSWLVSVLDAAELVKEATVHGPTIGSNGNWYTWDFESKQYIDTGVAASGGSGDHSKLINLDANDQHPMSAITGLVGALGDKMDSNNPVGTGSFSLNRDTNSTIGDYSVAEGNRTKASGAASHAEGNNTTASGANSHAEGYNTTAGEYSSHAEGSSTTAYGKYSHAEGITTHAGGLSSHAEGFGTIASGKAQHVHGEYNIEEFVAAGNRGKYVHIVGNGQDDNFRSNAHTLDWSGNAWFAGDVFVGSASGTNKDDGSKKLATEEYVNNEIADCIKAPATASVGQTIIVKAVDESGKPTEWEAADMEASGGGGASYRSWSKVWTLAVAEDIAGFTASNIDLDGKSEIMIVFISDSTASRTMVNGRLRINGVDAGKVLFNSLQLKKDSHSFVIIGRADVGIEYTTMQATAEYQTYPWQGEVKIVHRMVSGTGSIIQWTAGSTIEITQASATLGQGITIEIYVR